jgi:hypothetical protein
MNKGKMVPGRRNGMSGGPKAGGALGHWRSGKKTSDWNGGGGRRSLGGALSRLPQPWRPRMRHVLHSKCSMSLWDSGVTSVSSGEGTGFKSCLLVAMKPQEATEGVSFGLLTCKVGIITVLTSLGCQEQQKMEATCPAWPLSFPLPYCFLLSSFFSLCLRDWENQISSV